MSAPHAPTPWAFRADRTIADANGVPLLRGYAGRNWEETGPRIVRAVNSHEAMMSAADELIGFIDAHVPLMKDNPLVEELRAALSLAKGGEG